MNHFHDIEFFLVQAEEEARGLQKKIQTVENDLDQTQEALMQVNAKLEEKNKNLQNVSTAYYNFKYFGGYGMRHSIVGLGN